MVTYMLSVVHQGRRKAGLASSCGEPESPATGFGFSGTTRRPGPTAALVHDRWAFQASWGVVCAISHSVMHQDRFLQMSADSTPVCRRRLHQKSSGCALTETRPHAMTAYSRPRRTEPTRPTRRCNSEPVPPRCGGVGGAVRGTASSNRATREPSALGESGPPSWVRGWCASCTNYKRRVVPGKRRSAPSPAAWCAAQRGALRPTPARGPLARSLPDGSVCFAQPGLLASSGRHNGAQTACPEIYNDQTQHANWSDPRPEAIFQLATRFFKMGWNTTGLP